MKTTHLPEPQDAEATLREYDVRICPARQRFAASRGLVGMTSPDTDARTLAAFLLQFSALSVPITEPVEGWIRRAGERCTVLGWPDLGRALYAHAEAEAGHHKYHADDFAAMVALWNARWSPPVLPEQISGIGVTCGGDRYCRIHEDNIRGDAPYCQFAIEYEIELLPVEFGPAFVRNCVRLFGEVILRCLTFVTTHVEFDVGHTRFNAHFLGKLIADAPARLSALAAAGTAALDAFGDHLAECWDRGVALSRSA